MRRIDESSDTAYRIFKGRDTTQHDSRGRPARANKWYFEPMYHDGGELFSNAYDSAADAGAAIDECDEPARPVRKTRSGRPTAKARR